MKKVQCDYCDGRGLVTTMGWGDNMDIDLDPCDYCDGSGEIEEARDE